ncbi:MAG: methyltransferase domain-containing protein [Opitutae bacterium]|nr:methyltransferase domain-containing protein [Opitutae bacterium]
MKNVTREVNKVYREQNPSTYFRSEARISSFVENNKSFLLQLKIPPRAILNSTLIDFGCGSGQRGLVFDHLGADCTLVEYDKQSYKNASALFEKHAQNNFKIINSDLFDFEFPKESFDFVLSMGVAHHTKDPIRNIELCCQALKPGGMFIFGIGNKAGFFQRNLQRLIVYSISENNEDIIKYSKILFKEHLQRCVEYGGRTIDEIVYDTYINPKIYAFGTAEVIDVFAKNKLNLYSSYQDLKNVQSFLEPTTNQFHLMDDSNGNPNSSPGNNTIFFSDFEDFSLSNNELNNADLLKQLKSLMPHFNEITDQINDISFDQFDLNIKNFLKEINDYKKKILQIKKIDIINKKHNEVFIDEVTLVMKALNKSNKKLEKFYEVQKILDNNQRLFKLVNGVGMNYYCGYKNE